MTSHYIITRNAGAMSPRLRDRADLFCVVINLSILCTFAACVSTTQAFACAETCPMSHSKYIEVPDFSEHHYVGLPLREFFPFWRYEWFRSATIPSVLAHSFEASGHYVVMVSWIEQSSFELLMRDINLSNFASVQFVNLIFRDYMARWQIGLLTHWHNVCVDSPPQMFGWSPSDVRYMNGDTDRLTFHKRCIGIIAEFQPRPLLDHILSLGVHKTLLGGTSGIPSSIRRFFKFWILPNDLSELTAHYFKLAVINPGNDNGERDRPNFKHNFPKWCWIGMAIGAFILMCHGWWNLRNEIRIGYGFCSFCLGIGIWIYTVGRWILHILGTP
jgi:hypothetical protein